MPNDPADQKRANKNQHDKTDQETANAQGARAEPASEAAPASPPEETNPKTPPAEHDQDPSLDNIKKLVEAAAQDTGGLGELARGMREYLVRQIGSRSGGADFTGTTTVGRDVAGRDIINYILDPEMVKGSARYVNPHDGVSGQIDGSEVRKTASVYVKTGAYDRAEKILREKRVLILRGDEGTGKRSMAVHLLKLLHQDAIFEIAPTLEDPTTFYCEARQGYLWQAPAFDKSSRLERFALEKISRRHVDVGSHLIITFTKGVRLSTEVANEYLVELTDCPDSGDVLKNHLDWQLEKGRHPQPVRDAAEHLRRKSEITELTRTVLRQPWQAEKLAVLLIQVALGERLFEDLLAAFAKIDHQTVEMWFESHRQLSQRLQIVSLAVLHGSSFQRIWVASNLLRAQMAEENLIGTGAAATAHAEPEPPLDTEQWKGEFKAKVEVREIRAEYGTTTIEAVVFEHPQFQAGVLAHIWQEFQFWRGPLLNWLFKMGSSEDLEYRIAAAAALSELSRYHAFDEVLREAVIPWADSDFASQRRLAAFILMLQALDKGLSAPVLGLLHNWAKKYARWQLRWTAAMAYSTELGLKYPDLAMRDLYEVFVTRNPVLQASVLVTLRYLFEGGRQKPQLSAVVLRTLVNWTRDERLIKQKVLYIFWELLQSRVRVEGASWPTILWLAVVDEAYERQFNALFSEAICDREIRRLLLDDLREWLELADGDQNRKLYKLLGRVLHQLFRSTEVRMDTPRAVIADKLRSWDTQDELESAGRLLATLNEKSSK